MSVLLAFTAASLFSIGTYLVLQRKLSRVIIGIGLLGHGANLLLITAGRRGRAPIIGTGDPASLADPLPQALALTAIVISFGVTALLLALAYRSWLLTHDDEIADDAEDRDVARPGHLDAELVDAAAVAPVVIDGDPDPAAAHESEIEPLIERDGR
ncbi:MAG: NADH-quinone oxidoreductase subunit K [Aquihabitans sp.]